MTRIKYTACGALVATALAALSAQEPQRPVDEGSFRFRSAVELINVTATVSDGRGRFVSGLRQEDFRVYEDGEPQDITHFTAERVPVSLGIVLDTSGSMEGEKMLAARQALQRFLFELLGPDDEVFLFRFDNRPHLVHGWTGDKERIAAELRRIQPRGATTLYDAIAEAVPLAASGRHRKKALLIISDGNDTSSYTRIAELKRAIRESELLVYAIGIDAMTSRTTQPFQRPWFRPLVSGGPGIPRRGQGPLVVGAEQRRPVPFPFPVPRPPGPRMPPRVPGGPAGPHPRYPPPVTSPGPGASRGDEPVNVRVLREITDDSGGRTEILWQPRDLDPATAGIADELSKQYFIGYPAAGKRDGKWHSIRVEVVNGNYVVRARKGYVASP